MCLNHEIYRIVRVQNALVFNSVNLYGACTSNLELRSTSRANKLLTREKMSFRRTSSFWNNTFTSNFRHSTQCCQYLCPLNIIQPARLVWNNATNSGLEIMLIPSQETAPLQRLCAEAALKSTIGMHSITWLRMQALTWLLSPYPGASPDTVCRTPLGLEWPILLT